jgi:ferredoxin
MNAENYISYANDSCIRNSYFHNSCSNCVSICPENVFSVVQNRIKMDSQLCTFCSACLGTCPTEAIQINSIDPNRETLYFKYHSNDILDCKDKTECLSRFDSHHFAIMRFNRENLSVDLSSCSTCQLSNELNNLEESIILRLQESNKILDILNISKIGIIQEKAIANNKSKILMFAKLRNSLATVSKIAKISENEKFEIESKLNKPNYLKKMYPIKHKLFVSEIRKIKRFEELKEINRTDKLLATRNIDMKNCTNCGDCATFCPTGAIFISSDKLSIWISSNQCISCGICDHICKVGAIQSPEKFPNERMYRAEELVKFHFETCIECKTPFIQRGDEVICDRCRDFVRDFSDIFKLARDL